MPSEYAELMNAIFRDRPWDASPEAHAHGDGDGASARRTPRTPKGVTVEKIDLNGLGGERLTKPGNTGWVLYVHGGGYMSGSARERREVCQYIADVHGRNVMSCNYRLAPEHLWPAQIDDTLAAWQGVLARGIDPADVIVAGESAGGTLALSLALVLKGRGMAQPGGIMALSPSVTQAESLPSHSANVATDYLLRDAVEKGALRMVYGGPACTEGFLRDPVVSPLYGDFAGLPPVFLSASDTECLVDDARVLYQRLREAGHPAALDVRHGCPHAFQMFPRMPEARDALAAGFAFFARQARA